MRFEYHPAVLPVTLLALLLGFVALLFLRYGTIDRCDMMRAEVRQRFPGGTVPEAVRQSPGGQLVVGLVEGGSAKLLTWDLTPNQCAATLFRLWGAEDGEIGAVLLDE